MAYKIPKSWDAYASRSQQGVYYTDVTLIGDPLFGVHIQDKEDGDHVTYPGEIPFETGPGSRGIPPLFRAFWPVAVLR